MFAHKNFSFASISIVLASGSACIEYNTKEIKPKEDLYATIVVSPDYIDFGALEVGEKEQETLQIGNKGNTALLIEDLQLGEGAFSYTLPAPIEEIAPGEWVDVAIWEYPLEHQISQPRWRAGKMQTFWVQLKRWYLYLYNRVAGGAQQETPTVRE